ncbi:hypothetical protein NY98_12375 [Xanthomonas citri pv. fuscans]|uniref:Uncharacterized protein n=2 Tax=Xanthomonas citri TaxID=346 RepID=A0AB34Q5Y6_XANCI|nr:hypothetical protein NY98_12375 [Xanthomonas citri pv. fuscans]
MGGHYERADEASILYTMIGGNMLLDDDARGLRIGSYLHNEVVRWAKEVGLPGRIATFSLVQQDAGTAEERDRRNRFYEQFGYEFDWQDPINGIEHASGRLKDSITIDMLTAKDVISGVRAFDLPAGVHHFAQVMRKSQVATGKAEQRLADARRGYESDKAGAYGLVSGLKYALYVAIAIPSIAFLLYAALR